MEKQGDKKFTWVIKDLSSLVPKTCNSDIFVIGGCKWFLIGVTHVDTFAVCLVAAGYQSLPYGWKICANCCLTIINQLSKELSVTEERQRWFDQEDNVWGRAGILLTEILSKDGGFLVNGEVKIVAEVNVLEVIGKLDEPEERTNPLRKIEENDGTESTHLLKEAPLVKDEMDVNGFQVLPSQVESVRLLFERHPDIANEFRAKNQLLRNACMSFLLSIIDTLCQSLEKLSYDDLVEADIAVTYLKDAGLKVDWLEKKLDQVKEKKEKELVEFARLRETEENLLKLKEKCREIDALANEQKAKLTATRAPLSFDDVV